ncbi:hypothetical protein BZZ01_27055 [Nostocales cyanobacterium HT-58-2]|nr:hypothetical protein BZZ01_27055 [Nostocales cyanobacterium HT-58-2]
MRAVLKPKTRSIEPSFELDLDSPRGLHHPQALGTCRQCFKSWFCHFPGFRAPHDTLISEIILLFLDLVCVRNSGYVFTRLRHRAASIVIRPRSGVLSAKRLNPICRTPCLGLSPVALISITPRTKDSRNGQEKMKERTYFV